MPLTKTDMRPDQDLLRNLQQSSSAEVIHFVFADMNALISGSHSSGPTCNTVTSGKMLIAICIASRMHFILLML